jgi:glycosyltransferase involved in cell wall biosynthesis
MQNPTLVSIVTPSYQQGRFIRQCIESVLSQDYPHIEYFVLDGGSVDGTREILESYGGRFFWKSEPEYSMVNAINTALLCANGSILAYLNSDDILLPGAVSAVVREWERRPDVDVFYGRAHIVDEEGAVTGEYPTEPFDLERLKAQCRICQPAAFWRSYVMERWGFFDEGFQGAMDYEYWQRIAANGGKIAWLDKFLACSRDHAETKTQSQRGRMYRDVFKSQWRHWGRVHPQWWRGLMDYFKADRPGVWSLFIPPWKKSARVARLLSQLVRSW